MSHNLGQRQNSGSLCNFPNWTRPQDSASPGDCLFLLAVAKATCDGQSEEALSLACELIADRPRPALKDLKLDAFLRIPPEQRSQPSEAAPGPSLQHSSLADEKSAHAAIEMQTTGNLHRTKDSRASRNGGHNTQPSGDSADAMLDIISE
eukprot:scaffold650846_cov51-Prasinocladus_malaysianus.AAC.1